MPLKGIPSINMRAIIEVENITSRITTPLPQDVQFLLRDNLSYVVSGAVFSEYAKQGMWDGCKHLYSMKTQSFPTGLLRRVLTTLNDCSYKYEIIDKRVKPELGKEIKLKNIKLRDYQEESVDVLFNKTRGLLHAATASGKGVILSSLLAKLNIKSLIIVPTTSLLHQTASVIQKVLGVKVGKIGDSIKDIKKITVATFQSLVDSDDTKKRKLDSETGRWKTVGAKKMEVRKDLKEYLNDVECIITDECFPGLERVNTEYGYMPISKIVCNKMPLKVWSFNREKQLFELKPIVRYFVHHHEGTMVKVMFGKHSCVKSTPNHKYYILDSGNIIEKRADELLPGDMVISMPRTGTKKDNISTYVNEEQKQVILGSILGDGSLRVEKDNCRLSLCHGEKQLNYLKWKVGLLGSLISEKIKESKSGYCDNSVYYVSTRITAYLNQYNTSDERRIVRVLNNINDMGVAIWFMDDSSLAGSSYRLHTESYTYNIQELFVAFFMRRYSICPKILSCNKNNKTYYYLAFSKKDSAVISNILCKYGVVSMEYKVLPTHSISYYNSREDQLNYGVSVVKSIEKYDYDGNVYNIEVEGNHNYLVGNNKLVSNCHHIISQSIQKVYEACPNAYYRYGLSATPFSDRDEDVLIEAATGRVLKELSASYLISKGWLSKPTIHLVPYKQQRGGNSTTYAGLYKEKITENEERNKLLTKIISMRADMGDSVLVSVRYLEHGKTLYNMLVDKYGDDVVFVNSSVSTNRLNEVLKDLSKKKLKICISTSILQEGVDVPSLNTLVMAGSPKSKIATMQLVGRVLRKTDDKSTVDVYDIQDYNTKYFSSSAKERFNIYSSEPEFILKEDNMFDGVQTLDKSN